MWSHIAGAVLGIWLMASPSILGFGEAASKSGQIAGPIAAAIAIISASEVTREVRWANMAVGLWLLLAPWLLGFTAPEAANSVIVGLLVIALSFHRGEVRRRFGGGWISLIRSSEGAEGDAGK